MCVKICDKLLIMQFSMDNLKDKMYYIWVTQSLINIYIQIIILSLVGYFIEISTTNYDLLNYSFAIIVVSELNNIGSICFIKYVLTS